MQKEEQLLEKHFIDLSRQAYHRNIITYSDFLNLNEQNILHSIPKDKLYTGFIIFGGYDFAERQMAAFIPDALYYEWQYPISALEIKPSYPKFAEKLGHRDILGALMNMGIDRSKVGDIILSEDRYFMICEDTMAQYFIDHLDKIRHTVVRLEEISAEELVSEQHFEEKEGIITSNRLDSLIACVYKFSRSQALEYLKNEKVFVNGQCIQNPSYHCKENEIVSVRGSGRFVFEKEYGETNKGRLKIRYKLYG